MKRHNFITHVLSVILLKYYQGCQDYLILLSLHLGCRTPAQYIFTMMHTGLHRGMR